MINSVSFAAKHGIYDKANVDAPQSHQKPQEPMANQPRYEEPKKNNHSVLKTLGAIAAAAVVIAGGLAIASSKGLNKLNPESIKKIIPDKLLNWEKVAGWKEPVKKGIEAIDSFGAKANDFFIKIHENTFQKIANFITGKGKAAEEVLEEVTEGVGRV